MQFRCAHRIGVLEMIGIRPEHCIIGTASRGGLEDRRSGGQQFGTRIFSRHEAPDDRHESRCHPSTGSSGSRRCAGPAQPSRTWHRDGAQVSPTMFSAQGLGPGSQSCHSPANRQENSPPDCFLFLLIHHDGCRQTQSTTQVDVTCLGDPPEISRSPDGLREGVRPTHGPTFFKDANRAGSLTADRQVSATTAPIPGARQDIAQQWPERGHRHPTATDRIFLRKLLDMAFKARQLSPQR